MAIGARSLRYEVQPVSDPQLPVDGLPDYMQPYIADNMAAITQRGKYDPTVGADTTHAQDAHTGQSYGSLSKPVVANKILEMPALGKEDDSSPVAIDPLTGQPEGYVPTVVDNPAQQLRGILAVLSGILIQSKATQPILPVQLLFDGDNTTTQAKRIAFRLGTKNVPALKLLIQNNTPNDLYLGLSEPATLGAIHIASGALFTSTVIENFISILCNGGSINTATTGGIVVKAWSNPEWTNMRGSA